MHLSSLSDSLTYNAGARKQKATKFLFNLHQNKNDVLCFFTLMFLFFKSFFF